MGRTKKTETNDAAKEMLERGAQRRSGKKKPEPAEPTKQEETSGDEEPAEEGEENLTRPQRYTKRIDKIFDQLTRWLNTASAWKPAESDQPAVDGILKGTRDGLASLAEIKKAIALLPDDFKSQPAGRRAPLTPIPAGANAKLSPAAAWEYKQLGAEIDADTVFKVDAVSGKSYKISHGKTMLIVDRAKLLAA